MRYKKLKLATVFLMGLGLTAMQGQTVNDVDGNVYNNVTIGVQTWMAENLRTTKYNDGTSIPLLSDDKIWKNSLSAGFCWNQNNEAKYKTNYGALYNWFAVNTEKLCPIGWHIPSSSEWNILEDFLGGVKIGGGKLKEPSSSYWMRPNRGATNETGFTALPGGWRDGKKGGFMPFGVIGYWWSSTEQSTTDAIARSLSYDNSNVYIYWYNKRSGMSVRCLRDF
jgi:uncharacterized protein (TIGR02145 family)